MSSGDKVPDVITTVLNLSNTGFIAIEASKHLYALVNKISLFKTIKKKQ